jgi:hypothetical protein
VETENHSELSIRLLYLHITINPSCTCYFVHTSSAKTLSFNNSHIGSTAARLFTTICPPTILERNHALITAVHTLSVDSAVHCHGKRRITKTGGLQYRTKYWQWVSSHILQKWSNCGKPVFKKTGIKEWRKVEWADTGIDVKKNSCFSNGIKQEAIRVDTHCPIWPKHCNHGF